MSRTHNLLRSAAVAAISVMCLVSITPAAQAQPTTPAAPPSAALTAREVALAKQHGLNPERSRKQIAGQYTLIEDGTGWVIQDTQKLQSSNVSALSFSAGICAGYFFLPQKVNNNLEYGAWDQCAVTDPNALYVHELTVYARQKNTNSWIWYKKPPTVTSPAWQRYQSTISVHITNPCVDGNTHDFHVWVYPTVHGVKFGAVESDSVRVVCGLAG
jgi:hypothetical protein